MSSGNATLTRQRLLGADAARAIAAIAVVAIHCVQWMRQDPGTANFAFYHALDRITRFSVPLFVILSGALLQVGYAKRQRGTEFLRRRFGRSLIPWIFWTAVYAVTGSFLTSDVRLSGGLFNWLLWGAGHLWFLIVIPQLYLVYAIWPRRNLWLWAALATTVQLILEFTRLLLPVPLNSSVAGLTLWHGFQFFPFWLGYFAIGVALAGWIQQESAELKTVIIAAAAAVISAAALIDFNWSWASHGGFDAGTGIFLNPLMLPFAVSVVVLGVTAANRWLPQRERLAHLIQTLANYSLAIYIMHPLVLNLLVGHVLVWSLIPGLPFSVLGILLFVGSVFIITALLARLVSRTPIRTTLGLSQR